MQLYKIFLLCLLFIYITSTCTGVEASSAEDCEKLELDNSEKEMGGVACCLTKFSNKNMCTKIDKDTYEKVLKGESIEFGGTTYEYHCYQSSKSEETTQTKTENNSSGAKHLALSLLIIIFFAL